MWNFELYCRVSGLLLAFNNEAFRGVLQQKQNRSRFIVGKSPELTHKFSIN
jgi:hypothetical protein